MRIQTNRSVSSRQGAFTLIELLVVIANVAFLAAMILPVLPHAKEESKGIQCVGNQRQMLIAWKVYARENRDLGIHPGYPLYLRTTELIRGKSPGPEMTWVFIDERQGCINLGHYATDMAGDSPNVPSEYAFDQDMPACCQNGAAGLAYADGLSEIHNWLDPRTTPPETPVSQLSTAPNAINGLAANGLAARNANDMRWMQLPTVTMFGGTV